MIQTTAESLVTPEELLSHPDGDHFELVDGRMVEINVSVLSSYVELRIGGCLLHYCDDTKRGRCWPASLGYRIFADSPKKIRRPDASYISAERFAEDLFHQGYMTIAPDLAVEVISDNDLACEVNVKVEEYLRAGVKLVWVIDPDSRTVMIHRHDGSATKLYEKDILDGESFLPGFRVSVKELFPAS